MKNIHVLSTNTTSKLFKDDFDKLFYSINIDQEQNHFIAQHIYITSDEEILSFDEINSLSLQNGKDIQTNMSNI